VDEPAVTTPDHSRFTTNRSRFTLRRTCVVIGVVAAAWSVLCALTGGVSFSFGILAFSSRNPRNPAIAAIFVLAAAWSLSETRPRRHAVLGDLRWLTLLTCGALRRAWSAWTTAAEWVEERTPPRVAPALAFAFAVGIVATSLKYTAFVAAGSDAWGYVSQAQLWATGTLRIPQPLMTRLDGFVPREALAPLAYRPSPDGATIVPVTSPGLPMLMAMFDLVAGAGAVFAVVPALAALTVWVTYLLGRDLAGRWTGVVGAALMATSPAFLFQLTSSPMSDIPAAAWWALSLVLALRATASSAVLSGVAAGIAILIRANLVALAVVPLTIVLLPLPERRPYEPGRHGLWFAAGVLPAALFIFVLYDYWYGSPLNSGYGTLSQLFSRSNLVINLSHFSRWLWESQSPMVVAGLAAPWLVPRRSSAVALLVFVLAVVGCYAFYIPFDAWWYLRFLLPAFPAMLVLVASTLVGIARKLPVAIRTLAIIVTLVLLARYTVAYAAARATFDTGGEQKYEITGRYIGDHLPQNAVIFSELYSGAIRYYGGRMTIRFGSIPADHLEGAVAELERLGYRPYLVAEDWEEELFRRQFVGRQILNMLADGPEVELALGHVRIYPLAR
jgi:hypothetical protein